MFVALSEWRPPAALRPDAYNIHSSSTVNGRQVGSTSITGQHTPTAQGDLEWPVKLACTSLDYRRKSEYLEKTHSHRICRKMLANQN